MRAPKRPITLRHLLTHTAGFSYSLWNTDIGKYEKVRNVPDIITCQNAALATPLIADPGEQWNYGRGLSFMINEQQAPTGRSAGSLAWAGLANTYFWIDRQKGVGGVYLSQVLPFADVKALPQFYAFEKAVYQSIA